MRPDNERLQAGVSTELRVTVYGFRVQRLWVHRNPAYHPCPQYGRRASDRSSMCWLTSKFKEGKITLNGEL